MDTNRVYIWRDLYIRNVGDGVLKVDSVKYSNTKFFADTTHTYPLLINPGDSVRYGTKAFSVDTGMVEGNLRVYTNIYNVKADTVLLNAHFGKPLRIDSAKAFDGSVYGAGIDADDYVVLYFNQPTNGFNITLWNINDVLKLSNGHIWTDGFDLIDSAYWNPFKTKLIIELSTTITPPTISVGDTIYPDSMSIIGTLNSFRCHYPVVLRGTFDITGIEEEELITKNLDKKVSELNVMFKEVRYRVITDNNEFYIYDITGKVIYNAKHIPLGNHTYKFDQLPSGIYFVKLKDGDTQINRKVFVIK
ncbi:MAG: T9SS type A sorting domain-containing protein [candidate division WOR-3 bacterium]